MLTTVNRYGNLYFTIYLAVDALLHTYLFIYVLKMIVMSHSACVNQFNLAYNLVVSKQR